MIVREQGPLAWTRDGPVLIDEIRNTPRQSPPHTGALEEFPTLLRKPADLSLLQLVKAMYPAWANLETEVLWMFPGFKKI